MDSNANVDIEKSMRVLPQLSFEAQQVRATELAKQAEYILQQELAKRQAAEKLAKTLHILRQEMGENQLLLIDSVAKVYVDSDLKPMWSDKEAEKRFLRAYALFAVSGVSAKSAKALQQILNTPEGFLRDILLTDSFLDYLYYHRHVSKFANDWLYNLGSYSTKPPAESDVVAWQNAVVIGRSAQFIADLEPTNHIYQASIEMLLQHSPNTVLNVQSESQRGKKNGVNNKQQTVSFHKLALNIQRLRLIPSFHNGIFVNIPSYQLYYFRDGKLALQSKVIVGRDERRTPVMYSKLSNVVVNPPWHVPASIKNKDLVPKMRLDPSYVERHGYEIIDHRGNRVNPYSINWEGYDNPNKNFPYHLRQKAGDDSALGRYKFNMPSSDAIYLHDTPSRSLFNKKNRSLSSGCVRVAKSDELATLLLKEAGWSEQRKQNVLASKKTTSAPIRSDNPVYLYYVTSWVENGKIHVLPDIYRFDTKIPKYTIDWEKIKNLI
ncbi:MAG: L,D-transpeptidase family protein [Pasteurellaceae bacterium]|nr:L,D-transpeptidase family protein [Pasteurellaceae bacterium]